MGNFIKKFENNADYLDGKDSLETPHVVLLEDSGNVILSGDAKPLKYVDLGLPSGLKWATCNIGAGSPEEAGQYFSWGNVDGHYDIDDINWNEATYNNTTGHNLSGDIPTNATYDAARANLGEPWRMPTKTEFQELYDNCISRWCKVNRKAGRLFTSKINGKSIFFPAAGYFYGSSRYSFGSSGLYWSSSFFDSSYAYYLSFNSLGVYPQSYSDRYYGFPVRPVQD